MSNRSKYVIVIKNMTKNIIAIAFLLVMAAFSIGVAKPALACDPLGCLLIGKDQDILAIVTVSSVDGKIATVAADHFYDQSTTEPDGSFTIDFTDGSPWFPVTPEVGKHYLVSLACEETICVPKWGTWEVDSAVYQETRLLEIKNGDDAAIQWIAQGNTANFFGEEGRTYVKTPGGVLEIYPEYKIVRGPDQDVEASEERSRIFKIIFIAFWAVLLVVVAFVVWKKKVRH